MDKDAFILAVTVRHDRAEHYMALSEATNESPMMLIIGENPEER